MSRIISPAMRMRACFSIPSTPMTTLFRSTRSFQTSSRRFAEAAPLAVKKPVGAFRGGLFGFLLGSTGAGASVYYYILQEYKVSNELLTEDIYTLQAAVQRVHTHLTTLEEKIAAIEKKK